MFIIYLEKLMVFFHLTSFNAILKTFSPVSNSPIARPGHVEHTFSPTPEARLQGGWSMGQKLATAKKVDMFTSYIYLGKLSYFTNLNCSAIWGWFPLLTMIPVRENSEVVIIYPYIYILYVYFINSKTISSNARKNVLARKKTTF